MGEWKCFEPAVRLEDIRAAQDSARAQTQASLIHTLDVKTRAMVSAMVSTIRESHLKLECAALLNAQRKTLIDRWRAESSKGESAGIDTFVQRSIEECSSAFKLIMDRFVLEQSWTSSSQVS